jgi:hypothetical protein
MVRVHFYPIEGKEQNSDSLLEGLRESLGDSKVPDFEVRRGGKLVCDINIPNVNPRKGQDYYNLISSHAEISGYEARDRYGTTLSPKLI